MAIFLKPLHQTETKDMKSRHKRDITRIFMRPRKNEKRSERIVKQYNKPLMADVNNKAFNAKTSKSITSRSVNSSQPQVVRPLHQQLKNFLNLSRRLRNKRDIKGEYDLIEEEHQQMDLTLPEIIQYMPETLQPNFQRGPCQFGQSCINTKLPNKSTATSPIQNISEDENSAFDSSNIDSENLNLEEVEENEYESDNAINTLVTKRNAAVYRGVGGCPLVYPSDNPTPSPNYSFEPLSNPCGLDPVPQQYVAAPYTKERSIYGYPNSQPINNAQMDQIIAEIVNKHADFIDATSYHGGALVKPLNEQEYQTKSLLKNLAGGYIHSRFGGGKTLSKQPYYQSINTLPPLVAY